MEYSPHTLDFYPDSVQPFLKVLYIELNRINFDDISKPDSSFKSGILNRYIPGRQLSYSCYHVENDCKTLLFEHGFGRCCDFVLIQAFLNQYRNHPEKLPVVHTDELEIEVNVECIPIYQQLLEIMLMPLNSYEDFYRAMQKYETVTGTQVLNTVMYKKAIFTGAIEDWREPVSDEYEYVKKISEHEYHIGYSERGGERIDYIMHDVRLVYEYILERYCKLITF